MFIENEVPNEQRHIKDEYPENYFSAVTLNGKFIYHYFSLTQNTYIVRVTEATPLTYEYFPDIEVLQLGRGWIIRVRAFFK